MPLKHVVVKESKIPYHWSSAVPKKHKPNAILGVLHRAHKISSNFIQSAFNSYQEKCESLIPN